MWHKISLIQSSGFDAWQMIRMKQLKSVLEWMRILEQIWKWCVNIPKCQRSSESVHVWIHRLTTQVSHPTLHSTYLPSCSYLWLACKSSSVPLVLGFHLFIVTVNSDETMLRRCLMESKLYTSWIFLVMIIDQPDIAVTPFKGCSIYSLADGRWGVFGMRNVMRPVWESSVRCTIDSSKISCNSCQLIPCSTVSSDFLCGVATELMADAA